MNRIKAYHYRTSSIHKKVNERGKKELQNNQKAINKMVIVPYLSLSTLNVSALHSLD